MQNNILQGPFFFGGEGGKVAYDFSPTILFILCHAK